MRRRTHMTKTLALTITLVLVGAGTALADWDIGDPYKMHFPQLPDENDTGLDVHASWPWQPGVNTGKILADDFLCTQTGPITDIHIWGSWLNDVLPNPNGTNPDANAVSFKLSIHEDIPDPDGTGPLYSQPGPKLWETVFSSTNPNKTARLWSTGPEQFYDPNLDQIIGSDSQIWQYNFDIDAAEAFVQQAGTIYWLDVQAVPDEQQAVFGWKTSRDKWNDDAVWGDTDAMFGDVNAAGWSELIYPPGHQLEGLSIDLAFVITPEPASMAFMALGGLLMFRRRKTTA